MSNDTDTAFYVITHELPTHWATALMYDDTSGLDPEDQAQYDAYCRAMDERYLSWHCVDISDDDQFMRHHDAAPYGVLACNVATFMFHVVDA